MADELLRHVLNAGELDRQASGRHGIVVKAVLGVVEALGGREVGALQEGEVRVPIAPRLDEESRRDPGAVAGILVAPANGERVPLGRLAKLETVDHQPRVGEAPGQSWEAASLCPPAWGRMVQMLRFSLRAALVMVVLAGCVTTVPPHTQPPASGPATKLDGGPRGPAAPRAPVAGTQCTSPEVGSFQGLLVRAGIPVELLPPEGQRWTPQDAQALLSRLLAAEVGLRHFGPWRDGGTPAVGGMGGRNGGAV